MDGGVGQEQAIGERWAEPDPGDPDAMLRLAIEGAFQQFRYEANQTARSRLADRSNKAGGTISGWIKTPREFGRLVQASEAAGIAPEGQLSRLARITGHIDDHEIPARWWPRLATANSLSGETPAFRSAEDVIVSGKALAAFVARSQVTREEPDPTAVKHTVVALVRVASEPHGFADEAIEVLSDLSPVAYADILEIVSLHPIHAKALRALDRSVRRRGAPTAETSGLLEFLQAPRTTLFHRATWLRALRRALWLHRQEDDGTQLPYWAIQHLIMAVRAQGQFRWATLDERRFALWIAAEFTPEVRHEDWPATLARIAQDESVVKSVLRPEFADLGSAIANARRAVISKELDDLVSYRPEHGWPRSSYLDAWFEDYGVADGRVPVRMRAHWSFANQKLRLALCATMFEMLTTPCAIRSRMCSDTVRAAGTAATDAVSLAICEFLTAAETAREHEVQRAVFVLGTLQSRIPAVGEALSSTLRSDSNRECTTRTAALAAASIFCATEEAALLEQARSALQQIDNPSARSVLIYLSTLAGEPIENPKSELENEIWSWSKSYASGLQGVISVQGWLDLGI